VLYHSTVQYVKPAKIGTPGSAGTLATARTLSTAGHPATACSHKFSKSRQSSEKFMIIDVRKRKKSPFFGR
jgi:hypothetical protein